MSSFCNIEDKICFSQKYSGLMALQFCSLSIHICALFVVKSGVFQFPYEKLNHQPLLHILLKSFLTKYSTAILEEESHRL